MAIARVERLMKIADEERVQTPAAEVDCRLWDRRQEAPQPPEQLPQVQGQGPQARVEA